VQPVIIALAITEKGLFVFLFLFALLFPVKFFLFIYVLDGNHYAV